MHRYLLVFKYDFCSICLIVICFLVICTIFITSRHHLQLKLLKLIGPAGWVWNDIHLLGSHVLFGRIQLNFWTNQIKNLATLKWYQFLWIWYFKGGCFLYVCICFSHFIRIKRLNLTLWYDSLQTTSVVSKENMS